MTEVMTPTCADRLNSKVAEMRKQGMIDIKFFFVGGDMKHDLTEDLCAEVLSMIDGEIVSPLRSAQELAADTKHFGP